MLSVPPFRVGLGCDSHRIEAGGVLIIGGVKLEANLHLVGHSDADVLLHAITDAVLSAAGLSDIGQLFPNTHEENRGRDSGEMLSFAMQQVRAQGWEIVNIDAVVQMEKPKLSPHRTLIQSSIATLMGITVDQVSIKGKTGEGVGEIGRGELATATCVALLFR